MIISHLLLCLYDLSGGRISLAWLRRTKFRLRPSHDFAAGPSHEAAGGHTIQTYPTTSSECMNQPSGIVFRNKVTRSSARLIGDARR